MSSELIRAIDGIDAERPAVADDKVSLSYGEMRSRAQRLASLLDARFGRAGYLALRSPLSVDFVVSLLGVIYSGNTPIPIDVNTPAETLEYLLSKSGARAVLDPFGEDAAAALAPLNAPTDAMPAIVMFTSGTSGYSKGVKISHANLVHSCAAMSDYLDYRANPSAAVVLPMFYSYGLLSQVVAQLFVGGFVRLFPNFRNFIAFEKSVQDLELRTFCGVPSTFVTLAKVHGMRRLHMPSVRVVCSAGAAMNRAVFSEVKEIFPNSVFFNNYGMTEAAPRISYVREDDPRFFEPTCGQAMPGVEIKIVDPQTHAALPEREAGLVVVKGPNITAGYLNDDEITRKSFTSDGCLISGDIGYLQDGYLYLLGRQDDIFNVGGAKVAPLEIERVLNEIPEVETAAVRGVPDSERGMVPAAFLILKQRVTRARLEKAIDGRLQPAAHPKYFFQVTALPMTPNGKIKRRDLDVRGANVLSEIL